MTAAVLPQHERVQTLCLVMICAILSSAALYWLEPVLVPLVLAVLLSYCLSPIVEIAERRAHFPHGMAVTLALVVGLSALVLFLLVVSVAAHDIVGKAKQYEAYVIALSNKFAQAHRSAQQQLATSRIAAKVIETAQSGNLVGSTISDLSIGSFMVNTTQALLASFANWLSNSLLVIVFVIYLLEGQRKRKNSRRGGIVGRIEGRIQRYMSIKLGLSVANGVLAWGMYRLLKLDLAIAFGVLNFIPSVGPLVATVIPLPVVLVSPGRDSVDLLLAIGLPVMTHFVVGHIIEPKLMGDSLELHPITVLLSLIFWGRVWGVPGMLLAAPITAAAKLIFESIEVTMPFAMLLSGDLGGDAHHTDKDLEGGARKFYERARGP